MNKFFDYIQDGVPVLTMNFPEYRALNNQCEVGILLNDIQPDSIANAINKLLNNKNLYQKFQQNCLIARKDWNWESEQKLLLDFWQKAGAGISI